MQHLENVPKEFVNVKIRRFHVSTGTGKNAAFIRAHGRKHLKFLGLPGCLPLCDPVSARWGVEVNPHFALNSIFPS